VDTERLAAMLAEVGLSPPARDWPESGGRFEDGRRHRIEIASVESPGVLRAVLDEADRHGVTVQRVSQGSGVMMLSDEELDEMAALGRDRGVEVCLFLGPRGGWDTGGQALVTEAAAGVARGAEAVAACLAEAERACAHGIRSLLVGHRRARRARPAAGLGFAAVRPAVQDLRGAVRRKPRHRRPL
jgi:sugar phosphate isomerase/epimerase